MNKENRYKITKFIVNDNIDNLMIKFDCDFAIEFSLWIICDSLNEFGMDKTVKYISQTIENRFMSQIKR